MELDDDDCITEYVVLYIIVYIYVCVQPTVVEDQKLAIKVRGPRHLVSFLHQPIYFFFFF